MKHKNHMMVGSTIRSQPGVVESLTLRNQSFLCSHYQSVYPSVPDTEHHDSN
jgi:hypothetical protein